MITATNPKTGNQFQINPNVEVGEIISDPDDGTMLEIMSINDDNKTVEVEIVEVEEDWGE